MRMDELLAKGRADDSTIVEYSVTVYYTKAFRESTADPITFIDQVIAETNAGYVNSQIPLRAKLHCIEEIDIPDGKSSSSTLRNFVRSFRRAKYIRKSADAAILLVRKATNNINNFGVDRG